VNVHTLPTLRRTHADICREANARKLAKVEEEQAALGFVPRRVAVERTGLSEGTIRDYVHSRKLTGKKVNNLVYFPLAEVEALAARIEAAGGVDAYRMAQFKAPKRVVSPGRAVRSCPDKRKAPRKQAWVEPTGWQADFLGLVRDCSDARAMYREVCQFEAMEKHFRKAFRGVALVTVLRAHLERKGVVVL
jgi:hypothetical protein